jgi:hypothetical protein
MEFEQPERYYRQLQEQRDRGELDEDTFRLEVAKLLLRDEHGVFWMLDSESGKWFCNCGDGWTECDPHAQRPLEAELSAHSQVRSHGTLWVWLGITALVILGVGTFLISKSQTAAPESQPQPPAIATSSVQVTIASPLDGSEVALGQEVGIECTLASVSDLQAVARVELKVDGQGVDARSVRPSIQGGQSSLPLSLPWRPTVAGEHRIEIMALSDSGNLLGVAAITLHVAASALKALPETACVPDASFVTDVTIPAGTAFPPTVEMDKVWQVRNQGTCAWGTGYELVLVDGDSLGAPASVPVPPTAASELADLTITFWAPSSAGTYTSTWQLQSPAGEFFGPFLSLNIRVEVLAPKAVPPEAPADLQAVVTDDGKSVRLTWLDRSDNEDAFRIYREDVEASIGLAPADTTLFVDKTIACGHSYRYSVVAFNAAGASPASGIATVVLAPCAPADVPPVLTLTVVPTQALASSTFTVTFEANDDVGLTQVVLQGENTGDPLLDAGRTFTCTERLCTGAWLATWTGEVSTTLTLVGIASDSAGQESSTAQATVTILP